MIPNAVSTMPPRSMLPASWKTCVPRERSTPRSAYAAPPSARIVGHVARVSTLLTTVGLPNRPDERRDRRLGADHPALALEALQHRGLLAADVGARADPHVQVERQVGAEHRRRRAARGCTRSRSRCAASSTAAGYSERR